ncbi:MAG: hypothetical protein ACR2MX_07635, partial [Cyclobacteriaceae bacterium]
MTSQKSHPTSFDHLRTILTLPFTVTVIIPFAIIYLLKKPDLIPLSQLPIWLTFSLGPIFIAMGLILFAKSLDLFIKIGNGTLA